MPRILMSLMMLNLGRILRTYITFGITSNVTNIYLDLRLAFIVSLSVKATRPRHVKSTCTRWHPSALMNPIVLINSWFIPLLYLHLFIGKLVLLIDRDKFLRLFLALSASTTYLTTPLILLTSFVMFLLLTGWVTAPFHSAFWGYWA